MNSITNYNPGEPPPAKRKLKLWHWLLIGAAALIGLAILINPLFERIFPDRTLNPGAGFFGVVFGVIAMAAILLIPVALVFLSWVLIGYGFGVGFGYSEAGRAIISKRIR